LVKESDSLVAVDEAYQEFAGRSVIDLTDKYDNLVVVRTFSKAFSMAGVRVGYLVASEATVRELNKVRPPNSLSVISLALAESALKDTAEMRKNVSRIVEERERCFKKLSKIRGIVPYPSEANFILFRVLGVDANLIHARLMEKGFVLRNLAEVPGIRNTLRVTTSTPRVNDEFIEALRSSVES
jgi:histidinol-phosphate aminotransferase